MKLQHVTTMADVAKVKPGDTIVVTCPKCKDTYMSVVDKSFKGKVDEKTGTLALSPAQETKAEGEGANPGDRLTHTCKVCGSEEVICCVSTKGEKGEKALEEKKKK